MYQVDVYLPLVFGGAFLATGGCASEQAPVGTAYGRARYGDPRPRVLAQVREVRAAAAALAGETQNMKGGEIALI